ncbi:hypothetical protein CU098_004656, partial [Rhizopus stolonifer]
ITDEIAIYPPDKNFVKDEFFWRFSTNLMQANCSFSVFPGYDCTTVLLPGQHQKKKPTLSLSHLGNESSTKIQPLFPYTWQGEWTTTCKVSSPPVKSLQFMLKRELGKAQVRIEKIDSFETDLQGDVDSGKNMLFGAFALVYVVEGFVSVKLDENHAHRQRFELKHGETLFVERDEDASPTSILLNAIDENGEAATPGTEATIIMIQVEEGKTFGGILPKKQAKATESEPDHKGIVPSQRRPSLRRPSLLVPIQKEPMLAPTAQNEIQDKINLLDIHASQDTEHRRPTHQNKRRDSLNTELFDPDAIYEPPAFALMHDDSEMPPPVIRDKLEVDDFPLNTISTAWIKMMTQGLSEWLKLPVIVCRGKEDG